MLKLFPKSLPPVKNWSTYYTFGSKSARSSRVIMANYDFAEAALAKVDIRDQEKLTAVEIYAGAGLWSCALVNSGIKRVIAIENEKKLISDLKSLAADSENKITVCENNPFLWDTYETLKAPEYLGPNITMKWDQPHSGLLYTGTIPKSRQGELFIGQLYDCILQRMSMYQFGRVRMLLWVPKPFSGKILAPLGSKERCKLSFVANACATTRVVESSSVGDMFPDYEYDLIEVNPFEISKLTAPSDAFYYVVRHLMVTRRHKLTNAIGMLGPGAEIILSRLKFNHNIEIRDMSVEQVNEVSLRFDEWPLRPRVLHEDTDIMDASRRRGMSQT